MALSLSILNSCEDEEMNPYYMVNAPRILAVKIADPEVNPDVVAPIDLSVFVGGRTVDQEMTKTVGWYTGVGISAGEYIEIGTSSYNEELEINTDIWNLLPDGLLLLLYGDDEWFDLPVFAQILVNGKLLSAQKTLRVTNNPVGKNPEITGVQVKYHATSITVTDSLNRLIELEGPYIPGYIAFTALTEDLGTGNDNLLYRWKVSLSKNSFGKLYVNTDNSIDRALLGSNVKAAEYKQSVVFSLRGKDGGGNIQVGTYDVYLVVRDKASNAQSKAEDRYGIDYFYFSICIGSCS